MLAAVATLSLLVNGPARAQLRCRTTFLPAHDLPQMWVKPRKVNEGGVPYGVGLLSLGIDDTEFAEA